MRLKSIWISHYKNLRNFTVTFDGESFLDVFVGRNGSGKSNFLEAVLEVFNHLFDFDEKESGPIFDYEVTIESAKGATTFRWEHQQLTDGKGDVTKPKVDSLPNHLITYYSGQNGTVDQLTAKYREKFQSRIKTADFSVRRKVIQVGSDYKSLLLTIMLTLDDCSARKFLLEKLRIKSVSGDIRLVLQRPTYANGSSRADYDFYPDAADADRFWRCKGQTKDFLDRLLTCVSKAPAKGPERTEGFQANDDEYIMFLSVDKFQKEFSTVSAENRFHMFDNLILIDMLKDISVALKMEDGSEGTISHFSDGQFQTVYIFAVTELFKDVDCLTLLDEPDAFLHPEWQHQFLQQIMAVSDKAAQSNHVLMSSHSASTLSSRVRSQIHLFQVDGNKVLSREPAKAEAIDSLSSGLISFSDADAKLSISDSLKNFDGPVVFLEGVTDEIILEYAWKKLYPGETRPFEIQGTFGKNFVARLLLDEKFCEANKARTMFGLFDFDEAFNDWNIKAKEGDQVELVEANVANGLVKKREKFDVYFMLLPVPEGHSLVDQVVNPKSKAHYKAESRFSIEHYFHGLKGLDEYFLQDEKRPRSTCIKFAEKQKFKFATEIIPSLEKEAFEGLRPLFEFIRKAAQKEQEAA